MSTIIFSFRSSFWRMTRIVYIIQAFFAIVRTVLSVGTIYALSTIDIISIVTFR